MIFFIGIHLLTYIDVTFLYLLKFARCDSFGFHCHCKRQIGDKFHRSRPHGTLQGQKQDQSHRLMEQKPAEMTKLDIILLLHQCTLFH